MLSDYFTLDQLDVYASGSFSLISSLGFDSTNTRLLVGDDPTDGNAVGQEFHLASHAPPSSELRSRLVLRSPVLERSTPHRIRFRS